MTMLAAALVASSGNSWASDDSLVIDSMQTFSKPELRRIRSEAAIPAMAAGLSIDQENPKIITDGVRSLDRSVPVTADDFWHIGSNGKAMTSTLIARLDELGKLSWDTTIGEVLGDLIPTMRRDFAAVNFSHLCSHHAGLVDRWTGEVSDTANLEDIPNTRLAFAESSLSQSPESSAGDQWRYSNDGYVIAAAMIEEICGETWESLIQKHVFAPLKMGTAGFGPPGAPGKLDQPLGHIPSPDNQSLIPARLDDPERPADLPSVQAPAGLVHLSIEDWLRFLNAHVSRRDDFLSEHNWRTLHVPPFAGDYAMGWLIRPDGTLWHNGWNGMWFAEMAIDLRLNRVACVACNSGHQLSARAAISPVLNKAMSKNM